MRELVATVTEAMVVRNFARVHAALGRAIDRTPTSTDRNAFSLIALDAFQLLLAQEGEGQGEPLEERLAVRDCEAMLQRVADAAVGEKMQRMRETMEVYLARDAGAEDDPSH